MKIRDKVKPSLPPVPGGTYLGICVYSIEVGEQLCEFKDKGKGYNNQVMLGFELCGITVEIDGKQEPRVLGRTFNIAKSKNAGLRKFIGAWEAKEFSDDEFLDTDTNNYVGRPAFLTVVLNETGEYSNIESIAPLPTGLPISVPEPMSQLIQFDMDPWDQTAFEKLPEWAQEKIKKSSEYQKEHATVQNVSINQPVQGFQMPQNIPGVNLQTFMQQSVGQAVQLQQGSFSGASLSNNSASGGGVPF